MESLSLELFNNQGITVVYSGPNMSDSSLGTWIQVILNDIVHCGRGYKSLYSHRAQEQCKSIKIFTNYTAENSRQVGYSNVGESGGFRCYFTAICFRIHGGYKCIEFRDIF